MHGVQHDPFDHHIVGIYDGRVREQYAKYAARIIDDFHRCCGPQNNRNNRKGTGQRETDFVPIVDLLPTVNSTVYRLHAVAKGCTGLALGHLLETISTSRTRTDNHSKTDILIVKSTFRPRTALQLYGYHL